MQSKLPSIITACFITILTVSPRTHADVVQLTSGNIEQIFANNELVFVNFYADWCRFSQMLTPIYVEAEKKVSAEFTEPGRVVLAKVDCDREGEIAQRFQVSKYPTLKMFRYGQSIKREYRGQRSPEAIAEFIKNQLKNPITSVASPQNLDVIDSKKRNIIGYFDSEESLDYLTVYRKLASNLRDDCVFYSSSGPASESERVTGNKIVFRPAGEGQAEVVYTGPTSDYNLLHLWAMEKCVPLVRELNFENAEELTEEGLPFMVLFHNVEDTDTPERYRNIVTAELLQDRTTINFLVADGSKFTHPLHHLGKSAADLPVLVIDSFRHMFNWKKNVRENIDTPGALKEFIQDLHSGKLHREFHQGPDPVHNHGGHIEAAKPNDGAPLSHIPKDSDDAPSDPAVGGGDERQPETSPPESLFVKLAPSRNRYTILRDEL